MSNNVDKWLETLRNVKPLEEGEIRLLCKKIKEILIEESNV